MITFIEWLLEEKKECLRYAEGSSSKYIKSAEGILEFFKEISIIGQGKSALEVRLENKNTVIVMPAKKNKIGLISGVPNTHKTRWGKESLVIEPRLFELFRKWFKKKFLKSEEEPLYTLIIRRVAGCGECGSNLERAYIRVTESMLGPALVCIKCGRLHNTDGDPIFRPNKGGKMFLRNGRVRVEEKK